MADLGIQILAIRDFLLSPWKAPISPPRSNDRTASIYAQGLKFSAGMKGKKKDAFIGLLATGLALETPSTEPLGSSDLSYVHSYCIKSITKNGVRIKVSYLGFQGNSKDKTFSWEIDAVKFRGRGILHFTGRNAYKMLGLDNLSNHQLDTYFDNDYNQVKAFATWFDSAWKAGINYPLYWYAGSSDSVKATIGWQVRFLAYQASLEGKPPSLQKMQAVARKFTS